MLTETEIIKFHLPNGLISTNFLLLLLNLLTPDKNIGLMNQTFHSQSILKLVKAGSMDSISMKTMTTFPSWSNNSIDSIKKITLISLIICSLEKPILPLSNVLLNNPLEPEICLVLWLLLLLVDFYLSKMLKKCIILPISYKAEIF